MEDTPNWKHLIGHIIDKELWFKNEFEHALKHGLKTWIQPEQSINAPLKHKIDRKEM